MKKIGKVLGILLLILALLYGGIFIANNRAAGECKDRLLSVPLPARTQVLDSAAVAGKRTGNGNGMQYRGALLLESALSREALLTHYQAALPGENLYVEPLGSRDWDDSVPFPALAPSPGKTIYQVELFIDVAVGTEASFWGALLNADPRGH